MSVRWLAAVLLALAPPAAAQPSDAERAERALVIERWTSVDAPGYAFETRVDTSEVACTAAPGRLFAHADDEAGCGATRWLAVVHGGRLIDVLDAPMAWVGAAPDSLAEPPMPPYPVERTLPPGAVRDLTGDGVPDVVLTTYSGGAHCCTTHWLVGLLPAGPRLLAHVEAEHGEAEVADLDGDGLPEWTVADWTFAYWHTSFAGSPAPRVILSWDGERLAPNLGLMTEPPGPRADLDARAAVVRADAAWASQRFPPVAYWGTLLDLLYAGRGPEAARFAEAAWPGDALGRTVFLRVLADRLWQSPYAEAVVEMASRDLDWL